MHEFLHMGGYGAYVWSAYGIAAVVLAVNVILPARAERNALERIARRTRLRESDHDAAS